MAQNDPLHVGVIGCSNLGRTHAKRFAESPRGELTAYCDLDAQARQTMKEQVCDPLGIEPAAWDDAEKLIDSGTIDAVVLVLPHALHEPMATRALHAGLHVLLEKPMVTSTDAAERLQNLAEQKQRVVHVAFQGVHQAPVRAAKDLIARGEIGAITFVEASLRQAWLNLIANMPQKRWRLSHADAGGGQLYDSGSHLLNTMLVVADLEPKRVHAEIDLQGQEVDVNSALTIRFQNGAVGSVTVLGQTRMSGMRGDIVVTGERGDVVLPKGFHGSGGIELHGPDGPREDFTLPETTTPQENFLGVVRGEEISLSPPRDAVRLARLMDAIYASAEQGRPVACAPVGAA
jgi:predicted dehydrogenase